MKIICALLMCFQTVFVSLAQTDAAAARETASSNSPSAAALRPLDLNAASALYADLKGRTVLLHPALPAVKISLANAQTKEKQAEALETMFREQRIAVIPDGEHFVMLVPYTFTNYVTPKAPVLASGDALIPAKTVNFITVPIEMVIPVYGDLRGKKIVNPQDAPRTAVITFVQTTPLSRQEICYALETQFAWVNMRLVPEGDNLRVEQIRK
jgi:hypothetical protein